MAKSIFKRNPNYLKELIAVLLDMPIGSITKFHLSDTDLQPVVAVGKNSILDVCMNVNDMPVYLEFQVAKDEEYLSRSIKYWAELYTSNISKGDEYQILPRTIGINLLGFELFKHSKVHTKLMLRDDETLIPATDIEELNFFELPKIKKDLDPNDKLGLWLNLFNAKTDEDLEEIRALEVPIMMQMVEEIYNTMQDDKFRELYRQYSRARYDIETNILKAQRKGKEEGLEEGLEVGRRESDEKWQGVMAKKDELIAKLEAKLKDNNKS